MAPPLSEDSPGVLNFHQQQLRGTPNKLIPNNLKNKKKPPKVRKINPLPQDDISEYPDFQTSPGNQKQMGPGYGDPSFMAKVQGFSESIKKITCTCEEHN